MKTGVPAALPDAAPIVRLTDTNTADSLPGGENESQVERARAFAEPLLAGQPLDTGEDALEHADGVARLLHGIGAAPSMRAAAYLVYAGDYLNKPEEVVTKAFGPSQASLVMHTRRLVQIQRAARTAQFDGTAHAGEHKAQQTERVRKMLLAFSRDLRVVLLRLASRLQSLRFYASSKTPCPQALAEESMQVFAPLANRLGIWQIKWEMEDLAFRFLQPNAYRQVAALLDEKRLEREDQVEVFRQRIVDQLQRHHIAAEVQGRPKHLYSIWKKMQGKSLPFTRVLDLRALRVVVADVAQCYAALSFVHELLPPVVEEFDDYIARPKPNGYQSLHTVVLDDGGRPVEVQIRTRAMHEHAEHGVAAHWAYKEAGAKGYAGAVSAGTDFDAQVAEARKAVLRQLLAWERDFSDKDLADHDRADPNRAGADSSANTNAAAGASNARFDDRIYVFTPQATVIELTAGATPIDFAYAVHTDLGHRCRGAKVDGAMVSLNTPLANGQTVEITASKDGGPSLDWLNAELGLVQSARSKAKVRAWFNARAQTETIARGRDAVDKLLQRIGKTAMKLDDLASQLGFKHADALFEVVGKDEFSLRTIETLLKPPELAPTADEAIALRKASPDSDTAKSGVLVVGVESLLTTLSRCCRPAPPDAIGGYVTRGKGVAIHRQRCTNFKQMATRLPERVISVAWGAPRVGKDALYSVEVVVEAVERVGLLRDITEVFSKDRMNVTSVTTQPFKGARDANAVMTFTVQVTDSARLSSVLTAVGRIAGVGAVRRK
jgi:GTP pyrophosphokinase